MADRWPLLLALLVLAFPGGAAHARLLAGNAGPIKVTIDTERGGALDCLWYDSDGDGKFTPGERWADMPDKAGLIFNTIRVPVDSLSDPLSTFLPGRTFHLAAITDTAYVEESPGSWRAVIEGHFAWAGWWPYTLTWEIRRDRNYLAAAMKLGDKVRLIGTTPTQGPFAHIPVRDLVTAWGMTFRLHYADRESYHLRAFDTGIDGRPVYVPAEELRWSEWANERWFNGKPGKAGRISPWPIFNLVSLVQAGAAGHGAHAWKAISRRVGRLTVRRGDKTGGWAVITDRSRGLAVGLVGLGENLPGEITSDLDYGDLSGTLTVYFQSPGLTPVDPFAVRGDWFGREMKIVIRPLDGRFDYRRTGADLDRLCRGGKGVER